MTTRGLRKADRELDFVFIAIYLKVVRATPERSRFPVREEGQVAWLESPNGLDAGGERASNSNALSIKNIGSRPTLGRRPDERLFHFRKLRQLISLRSHNVTLSV